MDCRLIAIDLDGTLMDEGYRITPEDLHAVKEAVSKGIKVVACSGRVLQEAGEIARFAGLDTVCIAANGAIIKDFWEDLTIYEDSIPYVQSIELLNALYGMKGVSFLIYAGDRPTCDLEIFTKIKDKLLANGYIPGLKRRINLVSDVRAYIAKQEMRIQKALVLADEREILEQAGKALSGFDFLDFTSSSGNNLEIGHKGVNKARALSVLCTHLGVDKSQVMTIGDNFNDIEMLAYSGLGVAMGNAPEKVKEAADYITLPIRRSGVAHAIDRFVFSRAVG